MANARPDSRDSNPFRGWQARLLGALILVVTSGCGWTDQTVYVAGAPGHSTFHNPAVRPMTSSTHIRQAPSVFLSGCAPFVTERSLDGVWVELGPPFVCVWEGIAVEVAPGESVVTPFQAPTETGLYRHRYDYGVACEPDLPLSQAGCDSTESTATPGFEVERELCDPTEFGCRFVPGAPNFLCSDGIHFGGPAAECTRDPLTGSCGYEFLSCP